MPLESNWSRTGGLIVLIAVTAFAAYLRIVPLFILLMIFIIAVFFSRLWAKAAVSNISMHFESEALSIYPDTEFAVPVEIENQKNLPLIWLKTVLPLSKTACVRLQSAEEEEIAHRFAWIMPYQNIRYTIAMRSCNRGVWRVNYVNFISGDLLGLTEQSKQLSLNDTAAVVVYPRRVPVNIKPFLRRLSTLERYNRGIYEDPTLVNSSRTYQPSDSAKQINWRLLAKQNTLQVNVMQHEAPRRLTFVLDPESFVIEEMKITNEGEKLVRTLQRDAFEHYLSIIGSSIEQLTNVGIYCRLVIPSYGDHGESRVSVSELKQQTPRLLRTLSEIDYETEKTTFSQASFSDSDDYHGKVFFWTAAWNDRVSSRLSSMNRSVCVITEPPADTDVLPDVFLSIREVCV